METHFKYIEYNSVKKQERFNSKFGFDYKFLSKYDMFLWHYIIDLIKDFKKERFKY